MRYYVNNNAQKNGDHEVHAAGCEWLEKAQDTTYLGDFSSCVQAVEAAKEKYPSTANGCFYCSRPCHTS